jgi:hypothetical protein
MSVDAALVSGLSRLSRSAAGDGVTVQLWRQEQARAFEFTIYGASLGSMPGAAFGVASLPAGSPSLPLL